MTPSLLHPCQYVKGTSPCWQPPLRHFPNTSSLLFKFFFLCVFMRLSGEQLLYDCWLASTHPRAAMWSVKRRRRVLECGEF